MSIGGVFVNGFLNYGLIHGAYGLPRLGFLGSAAATSITVWADRARAVALLHLRPRYRHFVVAARPALPLMGELFGIGWPVAITYGVESTLFLATGMMVGLLGEAPLAAHQIALNVASVAFMVPLAIGQAANVRVGYWIGAGVPVAARHAGFVAIALGVGFMMLSGLVLIAAPHAIVGLYLHLDDPANAQTVALASVAAGRGGDVPDRRRHADGRLRLPARPEGHARADARRRVRLLGHRLSDRLCARVSLRGWARKGLWWGLAAGLASVAALMTLRFHRMSRRIVETAVSRPNGGARRERRAAGHV